MGPRFFNRGKRNVHTSAIRLDPALQWGLGFSTEESLSSSPASLAPLVLQWGLGFSTEESGMAWGRAWAVAGLQWGLGFSTEESC